MQMNKNVCLTCLSRDRRLTSIHNIKDILHDINFTELSTNKGGICWECRAMITKFQKFKIKCSHAQAVLSQRKQTKNMKSLSNLVTRIDIQNENQYSYTYDPIVNCEEQFKLEHDYVLREEGNEDATSHTSVEEEEEEIQQINEEIDNTEDIQYFFIDTTNVSENKKESELNQEEFYEKFTKIEFSEKEMLRNREIKSNHYNFKKIPFKCISCVLGFTKKENYDLHMRKKHNEKIGKYICDVCQCRFNSEVMASSHRKRHYTCYRCKLCKYDTTELWAAVNHCKTKHANDQIDSIHCMQCEDVFKSPEELEQHMQDNHNLCCNDCGALFKSKNTLRKHKSRRRHCVSRIRSCAVCSRTFLSAARLAAHVAAAHGSAHAQQLAYCRECRIQYKSIHVYRNHLRNSAHHAERTYSCPDCNKKFASKEYFKQHYNFYHLRKSRFNCEICNKLFISDWLLTNHKQKHHGLSRPKDHSCDICGKKFYTTSMLRNHQLIHSEQRSYMCEDCGDTFKQRSTLYTHCKLVHKRN